MTAVINELTRFRGGVEITSPFSPPVGSLKGSHFSTATIDRLPATKSESQFVVDRQINAPGSAIVDVTDLLHIIRGLAGSVVAIEAIITTQATGADRTVTVDLQKSTAAGAFATILTTTINITNATAIRTPVAAVINSAALVDGDILQAVVTVAGVAGAQADGLLLSLTLREDPEI